MEGNINRANLTDYQYDLYENYLDQLDDIMIKRGQSTGLAIEYWHIKVDLSKNFDDNRMQNSYKHYVYDLFHFLPTINATPITYQIGQNPQAQGTSNVATGSFSLYLLEQPLPGDLFRFYPHGGVTDRTEIFRVTNVRYMRTAKNKLDLYEIDFETAPIYVQTLEHVRINEIWCWDTENFRFLNEEECQAWKDIVDCKDKIIECLNKWYDEKHGWYGFCPGDGDKIVYPDDSCCGSGSGSASGSSSGSGSTSGSGSSSGSGSTSGSGSSSGYLECSARTDTRPLVFLNTILKRIKKIYPDLDIKPIYGIGTAKIPIKWGLPYLPVYDSIDPDTPVRWVQQDYWDTFTCLSFQPDANAGELFNMTKILNGECPDCPTELIDEIFCHKELLRLLQKLLTLLYPLFTEEQLNDKSCDRRCCDATDPNYIVSCLREGNIGVDSGFNLFWDAEGPSAEDRGVKFCDQYANAACIPLYISWKDGAIWPNGHSIGGTTR